MAKQRVGLILFWVGVAYAFVWGVVISWTVVGPTVRHLTPEELSQTMWTLSGYGTMVWGLGVPLGALVVGIGALLHSGAKGSTVWKFGIGIVLALVIAMAMHQVRYFPPLFGIGGTLILAVLLWRGMAVGQRTHRSEGLVQSGS